MTPEDADTAFSGLSIQTEMHCSGSRSNRSSSGWSFTALAQVATCELVELVKKQMARVELEVSIKYSSRL